MDNPATPRRSAARPVRWLVGLATTTTLAAAVAAGCASDGTEVQGNEATRPATTTEVVGVTPSSGAPSSTVPATTTPATTAPPTTGPPTTVPVKVSDPPLGVHTVVPHMGVYRGGRLYLQGDVPSRAVGDRLKAAAIKILGPANVVDGYRIDPAAPAISDGRVIIDEPVLFDTGSATLNAKYEYLAVLGVAIMKQFPSVTMRIVGYTDDVGDERANVVLATARALAVVDRIASQGIDRSRFQVEGRGEADPVASNDTPEGRQLNRRIQVDLLHLLG